MPARSPNLNALAERWVRSAKQECVSKLILFSESSLRGVSRELNVRQAVGPSRIFGERQGRGGSRTKAAKASRFWRRDGKELYYMAADRGMMVVRTSPTASTCSAGPCESDDPGL
jgi:hypothetical protein